jgi:hypothetical protein
MFLYSWLHLAGYSEMTIGEIKRFRQLHSKTPGHPEITHAPSGVDWTLFAVGATASIPGALLGSRLTGRLDERRLLLAVGAILLVAGTAAILQGTL